jgi:hypothetical protein
MIKVLYVRDGQTQTNVQENAFSLFNFVEYSIPKPTKCSTQNTTQHISSNIFILGINFYMFRQQNAILKGLNNGKES